MHGFSPVKKQSEVARWKRVRFDVRASLLRADYRIYQFDTKLTNGNVATTRRVFESVSWDEDKRRAQDIHYNRTVCDQFSATMAIIPDELLAYRQKLSTKRLVT